MICVSKCWDSYFPRLSLKHDEEDGLDPSFCAKKRKEKKKVKGKTQSSYRFWIQNSILFPDLFPKQYFYFTDSRLSNRWKRTRPRLNKI